MDYLSVSEIAKLWKLSERTVRNYCACGKIKGAILIGKTWNIPENARKPEREKSKFKTDNALLNCLRKEKSSNISGGIYHKTQILLTYNSNHIEGSKLTEEQTRYIFKTKTIGKIDENIKIDDIIETTNHFRCIDFVIESAKENLTIKFIKKLHFMLKYGTSDSNKDWFNIGEFKKIPNEVGGKETCPPEDVDEKMNELLAKYNKIKYKKLSDIIEFHQKFECIHPFQDGNGRVGRLIMFKECLNNNIVPFIITDDLKFYYYQGLREWSEEKGYLTDTILTAQDRYKKYLDYFKIIY